jgi:hypothetical protein
MSIPNVAQRILQVFDEHRVPTNRLEIEVMESVFLGRCPEIVLSPAPDVFVKHAKIWRLRITMRTPTIV